MTPYPAIQIIDIRWLILHSSPPPPSSCPLKHWKKCSKADFFVAVGKVTVLMPPSIEKRRDQTKTYRRHRAERPGGVLRTHFGRSTSGSSAGGPGGLLPGIRGGSWIELGDGWFYCRPCYNKPASLCCPLCLSLSHFPDVWVCEGDLVNSKGFQGLALSTQKISFSIFQNQKSDLT